MSQRPILSDEESIFGKQIERGLKSLDKRERRKEEGERRERPQNSTPWLAEPHHRY
jgi:hypothetical protein